MELEPYVNGLGEQLALAAETGGEEARALAQRLAAQLDSAVRLTLLEVLAAAAAEITRDVAPASVELRLRGGDPEFVVAPPPGDDESRSTVGLADSSASATAGDGGTARFNLRLPDQLKSRVEQAADREGLSINAWLVRAVAAAVERCEPGARNPRSAPHGGQHYTGWGR